MMLRRQTDLRGRSIGRPFVLGKIKIQRLKSVESHREDCYSINLLFYEQTHLRQL